MKAAKTSLAAIALILASPAVAETDGTPGPTSNGAFNVLANISAPAVDNVHVYGLDDFVLTGAIGVQVPTETSFFCMIRTLNGGPVGVTISSIAANDTSFVIRSQNDSLPIIFTLLFPDGQYTQMNEGVESTFNALADCVENVTGMETRMDATINGAPTASGAYSNTFLISIAPK